MQDNSDFEARLKTLSPVAHQVDAIAAAYAAGRRNGRRTLNGWRGVAGLAVIVAIVPWVTQRQTTVVPPKLAIAVPAPAINPPAVEIEPTVSGNMWQLQAAVLERGLDGSDP